MGYFFTMIAVMARHVGQEKSVFTWGWLCDINYFLTHLSNSMARATDFGTLFIWRFHSVQVYWDHLCQDNSSGGLGSSPCVMVPIHCEKSHVSSFASGSQWHNCGCWLYKQQIQGHLPLGGPIKFCAPHKNFILHVPGSWVASQQVWHDGERSIHKEKLNRFDDVPDHLCFCGQTSKKILVEMRSVSAVHLEMFLSGSSLSGFSPHFVQSLSCPRSCYSSAFCAGGSSRFVLLHCSERLKNLEEMLNRFFFSLFFLFLQQICLEDENSWYWYDLLHILGSLGSNYHQIMMLLGPYCANI